MPRPGKTIPKAPLVKIMQDSGASRVADNAVAELSDFLEEFGMKISKSAVKVTKHAGRKTVQAEDIKIMLR